MVLADPIEDGGILLAAKRFKRCLQQETEQRDIAGQLVIADGDAPKILQSVEIRLDADAWYRSTLLACARRGKAAQFRCPWCTILKSSVTLRPTLAAMEFDL
jgi:hypothetical protein